MKKTFLLLAICLCFSAILFAVSIPSSQAMAEEESCSFYDYNGTFISQSPLVNKHCQEPPHPNSRPSGPNGHFTFSCWATEDGTLWSADLEMEAPTSFFAVYLETPHSFNRREVSPEYFAEEATCTSIGKYYYSCVCGKRSDSTFEVGEYGEHLFSQTWIINAQSHWFRCIRCGEHKDFGPHSGGTPTETTKARCKICDSGYGEFLHYEITQLPQGEKPFDVKTEKRETIFAYFTASYTANRQTYELNNYYYNFKFSLLPNGTYRICFEDGTTVQATSQNGMLSFVSNKIGRFAVIGVKVITAGAVIMIVLICIITAILLAFFLVWILNRQSRLSKEKEEMKNKIDIPY